jgi:thiazole/oxazole-forming peptide maturase SagD family component
MNKEMNREPRSVASYRENLPSGALIDFPYTALDRPGVPVYSAALWPEKGEFCNGLGYGTTEAEAMTGAFGELAEVAAAHDALPGIPRTRASYKDLVAQYGEKSVLNPLQACLEAGSGYHHDRKLDWVEARRYPTGETVLVPVEFVATRFADLSPGERHEERLITPITNGLGAGPNLAHALSHGLLELIQRDGNSVSYRALDQGVDVDVDEVADPGTRALLDTLDSYGIEVIVKLAATDFGMANLYVVGHDRNPQDAPHPVALSACGEAAHPDRERTLRKALLEFTAARARKLFNHGPLKEVSRVAPPGYVERFRESPLGSEEDRSLSAMLDWLSLSHEEMMDLLADPVLAVRSRTSFSDLPHTQLDGEDREALLTTVAERLADAGLDVLYVDLSPRNGGGEVRVVHAIVPGLEVETMSYGRIGARNLRRLLDRDSNLVGLGDPPRSKPQARRIPLPGADKERFGGPAWLNYEAVERVVGRLYPLYREPGRHVAALAVERSGMRETGAS